MKRGNWLRLLAHRLGLLLVASIAAHAIVYLAPGEPTAVDPSNPRLKPADIERIRDAFHLDDPLPVQYLRWMGDLASGELRSFSDGSPVLPLIGEHLLNSLPLFVCATLFAWTLAFPIGIRSALRRGSVFDRSTTVVAFALLSAPSFFLAYLLLLMLTGWFDMPVLGMRTFGAPDTGFAAWMDRLWHLAVPSLLLGATGLAALSRYVRAQMLEVLAEDFVRTAQAKGLPRDLVVYRHAMRNALLPFITMFGLMLPSLVGGSVIIEQIFAWPGIGRLSYEAIVERDFPVILTLNLIAAALTIVGTLLADLLYSAADPRVRA